MLETSLVQTYLSDVALESLDSVVADDEPELERPELPAQRDLPML